MIVLANAKARLVLNESPLHSERESRVRQHYSYLVDERPVALEKKASIGLL